MKKKPKGYNVGGVTKQELAEMKALAKKSGRSGPSQPAVSKPKTMKGLAASSGRSGPDQPLLETRRSLKGQKRNVSPEETRARKEEKKMGGGGMTSKTMPKRMAPGGKTKNGKLPMVEKNGRMVPFFAADGEGKMSGGGEVPKTKGYFRGGKTMPAMKSGGGTGKARGCGAARQQKFTKNG